MLITELQTRKQLESGESQSSLNEKRKGTRTMSEDDFQLGSQLLAAGDFVSEEDEDDHDDDENGGNDDDDGDDDNDDDDGDDDNDDDDDDVNDRHLYPPCNGALTLGLGLLQTSSEPDYAPS